MEVISVAELGDEEQKKKVKKVIERMELSFTLFITKLHLFIMG